MPDATASALLSAEARALAALRKTVALYPGKPRAAAPMLVAAVAASRAHARSVGAVAMARETGVRLPVLPDVRDLDQRYAVRAVTGYLKALDVVDEKREAGETVRAVATVDAKLELIAATEVPGAFSEERERIEEQYVRDNPTLIPVLLKFWNARLDGACPVCRGLHRTSRPWGVDFGGGKKPGRAHPRCVPPGTRIATPTGEVPIEDIREGDLVLGGLTREPRTVTALHRNPYRGDVLTLHVGGRALRLTANHSVLTPRGWIPAGELQPGDEAICEVQQQGILDADGLTGPAHNGPAGVPQESVLHRIQRCLFASAVPVPRVDLDRDLHWYDREIDIEPVERILRNNVDACCREGFGKDLLDGRQSAPRGFPARLSVEHGSRERHAANGCVRSAGEALSPLWPFVPHSEDAGLVSAALSAARGADRSHNERPRNIETTSDGQHREFFFDVQPEHLGIFDGDAAAARLDAGRLQCALDQRQADADPRGNILSPHALIDVHSRDPGRVQSDLPHPQSIMPRVAMAMRIDAIEVRPHRGHVLNLSVDVDESYFAEGVAVHNCRCFATYMPIPIAVVGSQRKQQRRPRGTWEWAP